MLSFEQLGSEDNWPASHSDPAVKDTLQHLSDENKYLRQQLANRADTKFVQGILQKSVKNVHLVQVGSDTDLTDHSVKLELERLNLKQEVYQLKLMLNSTYPGSMTVRFLQDQLAADSRLREYQSMQHNDVHEKLNDTFDAMKALSDDVSKLARRNDVLLQTVKSSPSAPLQVSILSGCVLTCKSDLSLLAAQTMHMTMLSCLGLAAHAFLHMQALLLVNAKVIAPLYAILDCNVTFCRCHKQTALLQTAL